MITATVRFKLRPGVDYDQAIAEIKNMIAMYQSQPQLIRKQICLNVEKGEGRSFYLWKDRSAAEAFFEMARPMLREQTGAEPEIELLETHVLVDNSTNDVFIA